MNLLLTLKSLYAMNGVAAVLLYLPQVARAWQDREHARSLSLVSFGGWCAGSLVTALYAWLVVNDSIFTAVSLGNMAGSGSVFLIAARSRMGEAKKEAGPVQGALSSPRLQGEAQGHDGESTPGSFSSQQSLNSPQLGGGSVRKRLPHPLPHRPRPLKEGAPTPDQRQGTKRTTLRVSVSNSRRESST